MRSNSDSMQLYWFPGYAATRSIFDFTHDVMKIEIPGFQLTPEESNNFGNVITLPGGAGYYIIGKSLVDTEFTVVSGSEGLFASVPEKVANFVFSPDGDAAAHLYFMDKDGLHYGHIVRETAQRSSLDSHRLVPLSILPMENSPLCILGSSTGGETWLFYINQQSDGYRLVIVECQTTSITAYSVIPLSITAAPVSIEVSRNQIALVCSNATLVYGTLSVDGNIMNATLDNHITGLTSGCVQCAFSGDGDTLFWPTTVAGTHYINFQNRMTGTSVSYPTVGVYTALKCGPDQIIYGLSTTSRSPSTLLTVTPDNLNGDYSVLEIYSYTNGGYFPSTGWSVYSN